MPITTPAATIVGVQHHRACVNETELHYVTAGDAGTPVLLVHGFPESWWAFRGVLPRIATDHRVIAVDLRGFGDSAVAEEGTGSATAAEDLRALVEHLGLGPVHLVGQDLSGMATFRVAARHPELVRSFTAIEAALPGFGGEVLADPARGGAWHIGALASPGVDELLLRDRERAFIADHLLASYGAVPPAVTPADVDELVRAYARPGGFRGAAGQYRSLLTEGAEFRALAERPFEVPVLAIASSAGDVVRATLAAATGRQVRSVVLDGVSHYAALVAPDAVADALLEFFATVDR